MILTLDIGRRDAHQTGIAQVDLAIDGTMRMIRSGTFDLREPAERVRLRQEFGKLSNRPDLYGEA